MKSNMTRRSFAQTIGLASLSTAFSASALAQSSESNKPNIILCMTDDLGWGDTGFNGHPVIQTPNLDALAAKGIRFTRFYAAAPVCSPTRGSCLTGRHPYRYGVFNANSGHMPGDEITLAETLKTEGYTTGHFGKWHLGTLTTEVKDSNRSRLGDTSHYSPPWHNGFDVCFSTEAKVPTYDPMIVPDHWGQDTPGEPFGTYYWTGPQERVTENLEGDNSRVIMDRVIPFIQNAAQSKTPFFTVIWFHTPHSPVVAGEKHRAMYKDQDINKQHYYGCISAMDEQVGRLQDELKKLGVDGNTLFWFCSDNGPAGRGGGTNQKAGNRQQGSAGPYRGRKGSLYEGGVRVPAFVVWPDKIKTPRTVTMPCCTSDYYPTILDLLGIKMPEQPEPIDGIRLTNVLLDKQNCRPKPIAFEFRNQLSMTNNKFKIISNDKGKTFELYDLLEDPSEEHDLAKEHPDVLRRMKRLLLRWQESCTESRQS